MVSCEVCKAELLKSGNANIYTCAPILIWNEDYKKYIEERHYICHIDNSGNTSYKKITIFPFCFQIFYDDNRTEITKLTLGSEINNNKVAVYAYRKKQILTLEFAMSLPWHNQTQVLDKLKMYSLFS